MRSVITACDLRWKGAHGIGRFASEIAANIPWLKSLSISGRPSSALDPFRLSIALWRDRPDFFFSPGYNCPLSSPCPIIITVHDLAHIELEDAAFLKKMYYRFIMKPALKNAAAILTVSDYFRSAISSWADIDPEKIFNVGNGVSESFCSVGPAEKMDAPYFLHVGNQRPHKNLALCLSAFHLSGLHERFRMICTGEPTLSLTNEIDRLNLHKSVRFVGKVTDEHLGRLYRGATALVFASLYEGFGIPIVEAMACGTAVITSNTTSMPEIAGNAALLVTPTSETEIAQAMLDIAENPELRLSLVEAGIERAKLFTWASTTSKVKAVLLAVAEKQSFASVQKSIRRY